MVYYGSSVMEPVAFSVLKAFLSWVIGIEKQQWVLRVRKGSFL